MALNFHVSISRKKHTLHLNLQGDFDGTSACELLDVLTKNNADAHAIVIHTENLGTVYPFGLGVLTNNLPARYRNSIDPVFFHGSHFKTLDQVH